MRLGITKLLLVTGLFGAVLDRLMSRIPSASNEKTSGDVDILALIRVQESGI